MENSLAITGLTAGYAHVLAVHDVSLSVGSGETVALLGTPASPFGGRHRRAHRKRVNYEDRILARLRTLRSDLIDPTIAVRPRPQGESSQRHRRLSRDSLPIQRIAFSGRVQATDGMVDGTVEAVEIPEF